MATDYLPQPLFYQAWRLAHQQELSPEALRRWELIRRFKRAMRAGLDSHTAAVVVGGARSTLLRWLAAFNKDGPLGLEPKSRRPKTTPDRRVRTLLRTPKFVAMVEALCLQFRAWGKRKIRGLLPKEHQASESSVGRVMKSLRDRRAIGYSYS